MMPSSAMGNHEAMTQMTDVPLQRTPEEALRWAIKQRDQVMQMLVSCDRIIAEQSRIYADERGLTVRPNLDQLRRDLFRE